MSLDYLDAFIDIENYAPELVIVPDSVKIKPMSTRVYGHNFVTAQMHFKTLKGIEYRLMGRSNYDNDDEYYLIINGQKQIVSIPPDYDLISVDVKVQTPYGKARYYMKYVNGGSVEENLSLDTGKIPIALGDEEDKYNLYKIIQTNQEFFNSCEKLNIFIGETKEDNVLPSNYLLDWKFRYRLNRGNYFTFAFEKNKFYEVADGTTSLSSYGNNFYNRFPSGVNPFIL